MLENNKLLSFYSFVIDLVQDVIAQTTNVLALMTDAMLFDSHDLDLSQPTTLSVRKEHMLFL